jgi:hypothetical protein
MAKMQQCKYCDDMNEGVVRGYFILELLLWVLLLPIGVIYTVWRLTGRRICKNCKHDTLVPLIKNRG